MDVVKSQQAVEDYKVEAFWRCVFYKNHFTLLKESILV